MPPTKSTPKETSLQFKADWKTLNTNSSADTKNISYCAEWKPSFTSVTIDLQEPQKWSLKHLLKVICSQAEKAFSPFFKNNLKWVVTEMVSVLLKMWIRQKYHFCSLFILAPCILNCDKSAESYHQRKLSGKNSLKVFHLPWNTWRASTFFRDSWKLYNGFKELLKYQQI